MTSKHCHVIMSSKQCKTDSFTAETVVKITLQNSKVKCVIQYYDLLWITVILQLECNIWEVDVVTGRQIGE